MAVTTPSTLPLDEIKSLKFTEGFEPKNGKNVQTYPGRFPMGKSDFRIHTFEEEIEFVQAEPFNRQNIGIYPEIKAPWFHHREGKDIAASTLKVLKEYGYTSKQDKVYLQCFDANELKRIKMSWSRRWGWISIWCSSSPIPTGMKPSRNRPMVSG